MIRNLIFFALHHNRSQLRETIDNGARERIQIKEKVVEEEKSCKARAPAAAWLYVK